MAISTALDSSIITRAVGYKVINENFNPATPNLPQRVAVLCEANTANQGTLDTDPFEAITEKEVGDKYGFGSPAHQMMRILKPSSGPGVGGIPVIFYPQTSDGGATAAVFKLGITVATTVTANATHKVVINGRDNIDGKFYSYSVVIGENAAAVEQKIIDTVNAVLATPVIAADSAGDIDFTTKWKGVTTAGIDIRIDIGGVAAGIVYAEISNTPGTGVVDISAALTSFGNNWNTLVINPYGADQFTVLETDNGVPDPAAPTGRYAPTEFKPYMALFGSTLDDKDAIATITDAAARKDQVTNVLCPAPKSEGWDWEAAANACVLQATIAQNSPHLGIGGRSYQDMPAPITDDIGDMGTLDGRNFLIGKGSSTALLENNKYTIQDFVTTYHPDGELPPKFRYVRDLNVDWNIGFSWKIIVIRDIQDKAIVSDTDTVIVGDTVSPKQVLALLVSFYKDKASRALIVDAAFSEASSEVEISGGNPARLDIAFRYKRSSTANQASTDAAVDFAFTV